jgi:serine/threonine protein kinase
MDCTNTLISHAIFQVQEQYVNPCVLYAGSVAVARVKVCGSSEAQRLQDLASERCSMPYRAPELFQVESYCMVDERTDIWVNSDCITSNETGATPPTMSRIITWLAFSHCMWCGCVRRTYLACNIVVPQYPWVIRSKIYRGYVIPWIIPNTIYKT